MEAAYYGYNGTVILTERAVVIKRGAKGFLLGGGFLRGDKTIPYSSIVAVQLKKAGITAGYIQFTLAGGSEAKGGLFQSAQDENSVNFHSQNEKFAECKQLVEERIGQASSGQSAANEIEKLAELRDKGILTEAEFSAKKKQLLGPVTPNEISPLLLPRKIEKQNPGMADARIPLPLAISLIGIALAIVFPMPIGLLAVFLVISTFTAPVTFLVYLFSRGDRRHWSGWTALISCAVFAICIAKARSPSSSVTFPNNSPDVRAIGLSLMLASIVGFVVFMTGEAIIASMTAKKRPSHTTTIAPANPINADNPRTLDAPERATLDMEEKALMASDTNVMNINLQNRLLDQLDDFWRETLRSGETRPNVLGKSYNEMLARIQRQICHLPQAEQDQLVGQLVNRNAEYIDLANRDKNLKNDLRVRLGMPPLRLRSHAQVQAGNHLAQVVVDTAVRATVWESIRGIFRLFR